jgi:hypothetical protein
MLWRRNLSIRQKLQGMVMVTCGVCDELANLLARYLTSNSTEKVR